MRYVLVSLMCLAVAATAADKSDGFVSLFNGKDLTGWEVKQGGDKAKDAWTVKDGILTVAGGSGWLGTTKEYGDFVVRVEWRVAEGGNSGIFLRVPGVKPGTSPSATALEVQMLDDNSDKYKGKLKPYQFSGGLYHFVGPSKNVFKGANEWNTFEITCKGEKVTVVYNGESVVEADGAKIEELGKRPKKGFIGLQAHGSKAEFRKVEVKELGGK